MSIVGDFFGGSSAAGDAADAQVAAAEKSIEFQKESRDIARKDLAPFLKVGTTDLGQLGQLVTDPEAQRKSITESPFYGALADDAQRRIFQNAAARGKVGSGGTAEALQKSLLLLGNDLLSSDINRRQNLASLGANAATGQANITQQTGRTISDLYTQQGNAQAAGIIGDAQSANTGFGNLLSAGMTAFQLSDEREKENIQKVGSMSNGLPVYLFTYKGEDKVNMGVMAQDVEKVFPDAVQEIDGTKYVNYGALTCH